MNRTEHILTVISEECAELSQRACKALRFGLMNKENELGASNLTRMLGEYIDLVATLEMLEDEIRSSKDPALRHKSLKLDKIHNEMDSRKSEKKNKVNYYIEKHEDSKNNKEGDKS